MSILLFQKFVGLVPLSDINIYIPAYIEVVGLDIRLVPIALLHCSKELLEGLFCFPRKVVAEVVRIHINRCSSRSKTYSPTKLSLASFIEVLDEIDLAGLDIQDQRRIIPNRKRTLQPVPGQNGFDFGGDFRFGFLGHVGHENSPNQSINRINYTGTRNFVNRCCFYATLIEKSQSL